MAPAQGNDMPGRFPTALGLSGLVHLPAGLHNNETGDLLAKGIRWHWEAATTQLHVILSVIAIA